MDDLDPSPTEEAETIEVRCAACGEIFQAGVESAGKTEACPACGALNDVMAAEEPVLDPEAAEELSSHEEVERKTGVPGWLWWFLVTGVVAGFVVAIHFLFANTWEENHLSELADSHDKAQHCMETGDFEGAINQYENILRELDQRRLESRYLQELAKTAQDRLPTARQDAAIAQWVQKGDSAAAEGKWRAAVTDYQQAIAMAPKLVDASDPITQVLDRAGKGLQAAHESLTGTTRPAPIVASTQKGMDAQTLAAIKQFQRASEGFAGIVSAKTFLFVDGQGKWRRRRYVIWDVTAETQLDDISPATHIQLEYVESSRTTGPHEQEKAAAADNNFTVAEANDFDHLQTLFVLESGRWVAVQRRRSDGQTWMDARNRQFLDKQTPNRFSLQDLWELEDGAFGDKRDLHYRVEGREAAIHQH